MGKNDSIDEKQREIVRTEVHWLVWAVGLGASLVMYGNMTFASKEEVKSLSDTLKTLDERVYDLHKEKFPQKHGDN